jgi:hypothetical protein
MKPTEEDTMTEPTNDNQVVHRPDTGLEDVEGHYLPIDEEGRVVVTPPRVETEEDVEGHVAFELDPDVEMERKR